MVTFVVVAALVNIFCGYRIAVCLGHATGVLRLLRDERSNASQIELPVAVVEIAAVTQASQGIDEATNTQQIVKLQDHEPLPATISKRSFAAEDDACNRTIRDTSVEILDKLKSIQDKLGPLRNFGDKSIARSLASDSHSLVKVQFGVWEGALNELASEDAIDQIMQSMAHAEATLNNIEHIDWSGKLDEITDSIEKQLSMFMVRLAT